MSFQQSMKGRARLRGAEAIGHIGVQAAAEGARLAAWAAQDAAQAAQQCKAAVMIPGLPGVRVSEPRSQAARR